MTSLQHAKSGAGLILALLVSAACLPAVPALAETDPPVRQFSVRSGEIVLGAQELMAANQYDAALNELAKALTLDGLSPYERAMIAQMQGTCFYELGDYAQSISAFERAIKSGGMTSKEEAALRMNIAQLLIASERFAEGAEMMEQWQRDGGIFGLKHREMLWQAWSQAGRYDRALPWAEQWFQDASPKKRQHFDTMNFLYNQLSMPDKQAGIIKRMIERWPDDKNLWDALASLHAHDGREREAFEVRLRQYDAGLLTSEQDLQQLIQFHSFYGIPYWGAKLMTAEMEKGVIAGSAENYTKLADLWRQAREYRRAIPVLKRAAAVSNDPANGAKLAEALYHQGRCDEAQTEISRLAADGGIKNLTSLYTQLGVCFYEQSQDIPRPECGEEQGEAGLMRSALQTRAIDSFKAAQDFGGSRSSAHQTAGSWTSFIKGEQGARSEMCKAISENEKLRCFEHIALAYNEVVLVGSLKIEQACKVHLPEYIRDFRPWENTEAAQSAALQD